MDLGEYLKISLTSFLVRLDATNITFRIKYGYNRCMARVWDAQKWDINKRCQRQSLSNGLCNYIWEIFLVEGLMSIQMRE